MEKVIGIDLGTTNSVVAIVEGGEPIVIPNRQGERLTPSVFAFRENGEILVGSPAKRQAITNPLNTVLSIKRFMGRTYTEAKQTGDVDRVPYKVVPGPNDRVEVEIPVMKKRFTPEQISAFILSDLKKAAENFLGTEVHKAVITVPAYFNDPQRQATKDAGLIAGFKEVIRILPEPTAAALAYGLNKTDKKLKVAVYDLGGGTFDISILTLVEGAFIVKATHGDTHLGGDDIDQKIIEWLIEEFRRETKIDLSKDPAALQRLKEAAEKAKKELSFQSETLISLPYMAFDPEAKVGLNLERVLTRARLEAMAEGLINRTVELMRQALDEARMTREEIDEVILVGGQTRMPLVQRVVEEFFGKKPHAGINPDEVVAIGAAIQASIAVGEMKDKKDIVLVDVVPLSLGVATLGDIFDVVIPKNTPIPVKRSKIYTTAYDNQTVVTVEVYQGERKIASQNRLLGRFDLTGIPPAPRGVPQIEVTFELDTNGILHVSAVEKSTVKKADIRIHARTGLTEEEIKRMIEEAERYREEDERRARIAELRNQIDAYIYEVEKATKEFEKNLTEDEKKRINEGINKLREVMNSNDEEKMRREFEEFQRVWNGIITRIYQQTGTNPPHDEGPTIEA